MNTLIKNEGITKTIISNNNNNNYVNEIKWDGDYNGKIAKLNLNVNDNGRKQQVHLELNNNDILKLLNKNADKLSIDQRLQNDFLSKNSTKRKYRKIKSKSKQRNKSIKNKNKYSRKKSNKL